MGHTAPRQEAERFHARHLRHNVVVNVAEGACYWIGVAFYSHQTVLPLFVSKLTESPFALGVVAMAGSSGWLLPQLFTAGWVQRTPVKKRIVVRVGFFTERLPFVLLALVAWLLAPAHPKLTLIATLVLAVWGAYGGGVIAVAWQSMIAKIIPQGIRGRFIGVTSALGMAGSALAAVAVTSVLNTWPFPYNFAVSFSAGAVFTLLSWFFLSLTREFPDEVPADAAAGRWWREVWHVLRKDRGFRRYILARTTAAATVMGVGFLAVYAIQRWRLADGYAGIFNGVASGAQLVAYLVLGLVADRQGHKVVLEIGALTSGVAFVLAALTPVPQPILLSFAGLGVMQAAYIVSGMMIVPEFAPVEKWPLYFGVGSVLPGIMALLAPLLGASVAAGVGYPAVFALAGMAGIAAWAMYRFLVPDPRQAHQTSSA